MMPIEMTGLSWLAIGLLLAPAGCGGADPECRADTDCPTGRYCSAERCVFDCTHDAECPTEYTCTAHGRCERGCRRTNNGVEACDGLDNDCDGQTDETWSEIGQACQNGDCPPGFWACALDQAGVFCDGQVPVPDDSTCDGVDGDCDGQTDEEAGPQACPLQAGVCQGTLRTCVSGAWSVCDYGPTYSEDQDAVCDGQDNDCDGVTDEDADVLPMGEFGPHAADGLDNNCNGIVDEPGGMMVRIDDGLAIDAHEMTVYTGRDCAGTRYGQWSDDYPPGFPASGNNATSLYACSMPGLIPSGYLSWYRAQWACEAQGKRLCTASEFAQACRGPDLYRYPYGVAFFSGNCNDGWLEEGVKAETGAFPFCVSFGAAYDMSGNLIEWVADNDVTTPGNALVGGGYYTCLICLPNGYCRPCDRDDPSGEKDKIQLIMDCQPGTQVVDQLYESFSKAVPRPYLGARCCMDL